VNEDILSKISFIVVNADQCIQKPSKLVVPILLQIKFANIFKKLF